ncbi:hypothetical protein ACFSYD_15630 [Paracoccus aerius]
MNAGKTGRRIAFVFLPSLPIERWRNRRRRMEGTVPDDVPVVLSAEGHHGPVVHDLNEAARSAGVRRGARVVDMRALCPALQAVPASPRGDAAALTRLMFWARRWGPILLRMVRTGWSSTPRAPRICSAEKPHCCPTSRRVSPGQG